MLQVCHGASPKVSSIPRCRHPTTAMAVCCASQRDAPFYDGSGRTDALAARFRDGHSWRNLLVAPTAAFPPFPPASGRGRPSSSRSKGVPSVRVEPLEHPAPLEPSHSEGVLETRSSKQPGRLHPVRACSADHSTRGGDQLAPPCASNSNLNIAKLYLPHQHMPTGRLPGFHQSHFRPLVSLPVKPQAHEIERRWRRSSFDCGGPERRASP